MEGKGPSLAHFTAARAWWSSAAYLDVERPLPWKLVTVVSFLACLVTPIKEKGATLASNAAVGAMLSPATTVEPQPLRIAP
jgi:hypothetical protein